MNCYDVFVDVTEEWQEGVRDGYHWQDPRHSTFDARGIANAYLHIWAEDQYRARELAELFDYKEKFDNCDIMDIDVRAVVIACRDDSVTEESVTLVSITKPNYD